MTEIRKPKPDPEMMTQEDPAVEAYIEQLEQNNKDLQEEFYKQGAKIDELKKENARLEESFQRATGAVAADALPTLAEMRKISEMCRKTKCKQCGYFDKKEHHCRFDDGADHWDFGGADDA